METSLSVKGVEDRKIKTRRKGSSECSECFDRKFKDVVTFLTSPLISKIILYDFIWQDYFYSPAVWWRMKTVLLWYDKSAFHWHVLLYLQTFLSMTTESHFKCESNKLQAPSNKKRFNEHRFFCWRQNTVRNFYTDFIQFKATN